MRAIRPQSKSSNDNLFELTATAEPHYFMQKFHRLINRTIPVLMTLVLAVAAYLICAHQKDEDFDTLFVLSSIRLGTIQEYTPIHRPLQYHLEAGFAKLISPILPSIWAVRILISIVSLLASYWILARFRSLFFHSMSHIYPALAMVIFVSTSGGEYMLDSWNDHLPLIPLYILGTAHILLLCRGGTARSLLVIFGVLAAGTALHIVEVWLWAGALIVPLITSKSGMLKAQTLALLVGVAVFPLLLLSMYPNAWHSSQTMIESYGNSPISFDTFESFRSGFALGGVSKLSPILLIIFLITLPIYLVCCAWGLRQKLFLVIMFQVLAGITYPAVYEAGNPERYYSVALVWSITGASAIRLTFRARGYRQNKVVTAASALVALTACVITVSRIPTIVRNLDKDDPAIINTREFIAMADTTRPLVVQSRLGYDIWPAVFYPMEGSVYQLKQNDSKLPNEVIEQVPYLTAAAANQLKSRVHKRLFYRHPKNRARDIYETIPGPQIVNPSSKR